jgi:hypothetical protein
MQTAFEISVEDVEHVLSGMGRPHTEADAQRVFGLLDQATVESAALHADDMDTQTEYAYAEVERQISERDPAPETASPGPK